MKICVQGEPVILSSDRAVYRPSSQRLYVADVHFGKAAAFRHRGVPVPAGTTHDNLNRLDVLIAAHPVREIVFLGDFAHARMPGLFDRLRAWRYRHRALRMQLVAGNHDRHAGSPPPDLDIEAIPGDLPDPPFVLRHVPAAKAAPFGIAGHIHPCYVLRGRSREAMRLPCFWMTRHDLILPAFGAFTGGFAITPSAQDRVFVIADDSVMEIRPQSVLASLGSKRD